MSTVFMVNARSSGVFVRAVGPGRCVTELYVTFGAVRTVSVTMARVSVNRDGMAGTALWVITYYCVHNYLK